MLSGAKGDGQREWGETCRHAPNPLSALVTCGSCRAVFVEGDRLPGAHRIEHRVGEGDRPHAVVTRDQHRLARFQALDEMPQLPQVRAGAGPGIDALRPVQVLGEGRRSARSSGSRPARCRTKSGRTGPPSRLRCGGSRATSCFRCGRSRRSGSGPMPPQSRASAGAGCRSAPARRAARPRRRASPGYRDRAPSGRGPRRRFSRHRQTRGCAPEPEDWCAFARTIATWPSSPLSMISLILTHSGKNRTTWPIIRVTPAASQAATIAWPSSTVRAIGFSQKTCLPAAAAFSVAIR